jgi:hypothetical protein
MTRLPGASTMGLVTEHYDVIVVGSGAGGARSLTRWHCTSSTPSFFPIIEAVDPALTAMANAIRVGEHLLGRRS